LGNLEKRVFRPANWRNSLFRKYAGRSGKSERPVLLVRADPTSAGRSKQPVAGDSG
jgi:hypothetical protein